MPLLCLAFIAVGCNQSSSAKRYHLTGKIISIDKPGGLINVDAAAIPGFMDAMVMPYRVEPQSELDHLKVDDVISADVVVEPEKYWLENIKVTQQATGPSPKPAAAMHIPVPGEAVPDFTFVNQNGRRVSLEQYRGKALLLTFIYTRCPFAEYCPRITSEFAEINQQLKSDPALFGKTQLLSISFDTVHDTPKVLRAYGFSYAHTREPSLFRHWEFAVPKEKDLPQIAHYFGLTYVRDGNTITHSLSTAVIGPDGHIFKWYHHNDWQPSELIKDAADALQATVQKS
ncbi:MAG TPA: SCO family protein [Terriglobales bacterium]|nr:SCO family protein [Terriglobales bacterium]